MFPHRRPLPTFSLALSSLPKRDSLDGRRDSQRDIFSGYYASLAVPRDLMVSSAYSHPLAGLIGFCSALYILSLGTTMALFSLPFVVCSTFFVTSLPPSV